MTEHNSLQIPKVTSAKSKLSEIQEQLHEQKTITVLPVGIIEPAPIVDAIGTNAKLTAEAFRETAKELEKLKETVDSPIIEDKIDRLLVIFTEIRDNEKAFFVKVEAELNR